MTSVDHCASFWPWEGPILTPGHVFEVLGLTESGNTYLCWRVMLKPGIVPGTYKVYSTYILRERENE